jgi:hypothetical protein
MAIALHSQQQCKGYIIILVAIAFSKATVVE